jgi:hypothetical protein
VPEDSALLGGLGSRRYTYIIYEILLRRYTLPLAANTMIIWDLRYIGREARKGGPRDLIWVLSPKVDGQMGAGGALFERKPLRKRKMSRWGPTPPHANTLLRSGPEWRLSRRRRAETLSEEKRPMYNPTTLSGASPPLGSGKGQ